MGKGLGIGDNGLNDVLRFLAYNRSKMCNPQTAQSRKQISVADNLLPLSDDEEDKKADPFEEFINKDLGMDSVAQEGDTTPADDRSLTARVKQSRDAFEEEDEEEDESENPRGNLPRFGGFGVPRSPFGSSTSSESPFGRSPFGNRPSFGNTSGSSSGLGKGRFSGSFSSGSGSGSNPFSRPSGSLPPLRPSGIFRPSPTRSFWERFRSEIGKYLGDELIGIFVALVVFLIVLSTMLYVDNLRMGIAVRDGQITELRSQLEEFQHQLTPMVLPTVVGTPTG